MADSQDVGEVEVRLCTKVLLANSGYGTKVQSLNLGLSRVRSSTERGGVAALVMRRRAHHRRGGYSLLLDAALGL